MLVLSRKPGQSIVIDDRIRVSIEHISGNRVRVAIDAPADVDVDRHEIWLRKQRERRQLPSPTLGA